MIPPAVTAPTTARPPLAPAEPETRPTAPDHEILRYIGRGAYGEIWLARSQTGAWRAIKFVYRQDFQSGRTFQREFEGMSAFEPISRSHDGFIDILQVGHNDEAGFFYYVMELADDCAANGRGPAEHPLDPATYRPHTLRADLQARGRLPAADCIELGFSLTSALGELHNHGLSHRDIKPDNIIFVNGVPKLADIGLVAAHGQRSFVGTEGYVPPEGPGGAAADLYSLGKVLYETAMGKDRLDFPEVASDLSATHDPAEPLLRGLNQLLLKACAAKPAHRYGSAAEMQEDLRRLKEGKPLRGAGRWKTAVLLAAGALLVGAIAAALTGFHPWHKEVPVNHEPMPPALATPTPQPTAAPSLPPTAMTAPAELRSDPPGLEIFEAGRNRPLGRTPLTVSLPLGECQLVARRSGWPEVRRTIHLTADQTGPVAVDFPFVPGSAALESDPPGASVRLDDRELGETPLTLPGLPPGALRLTFQLPGYRKVVQAAEVRAGEQTGLKIQLERNRAPSGTEAWENSLGMKFVPIGGESNGVLMDVWETRLRDFSAFVQATGYDASASMSSLRNGENGLHGDTWRQPGFAQTPEHPVVGVSWKDAYAFCDWLTQKEHDEGWLDEGQFYRLPTDLEWSRAVGLPPETGATPLARSERIKGVYPWGAQWPPPAGAGNYAGNELRAPGADWPAAYKTVPNYADTFPRTAPAGSFAPNALGLYDLGGNAWEWCQDRFGPGGETRVLRGGSWGNVDADLLLSSRRIQDQPHSRSDFYGFRVVLETPIQGSAEIVSEPPGADVFRGERKLGRTPLVVSKLAPGPVEFTVKLAGCQSANVAGQVAASRRIKLTAQLAPASVPAPGQPFENGLSMRFAPVGGGRLLAAVWETRVQDFDVYCRDARHARPVTDFEQGPLHPVVNVNRDDAEAFCAWLTTHELAAGRLRAGQDYRLPTDREWSQMAGLPDEPGETPEKRDGRIHNLYPWGKQWPPPPDAGNFAPPETHRAARGKKPAPRRTPAGQPYAQTADAGSFAPNEFGLYDLAGNAWEWCSDPYKTSGALRDWGVLRGGSWADYGPGILLSSYRNVVAEDERDVIYGFRCVLDLGNE